MKIEKRVEILKDEVYDCGFGNGIGIIRGSKGTKCPVCREQAL